MSATLKKPNISTAAVMAFAEGRKSPTGAQTEVGKGKALGTSQNATKGLKSGLVPEGDVRLTANIRGDIHIALKIRAAQERTTVGELIEKWVESWTV